MEYSPHNGGDEYCRRRRFLCCHVTPSCHAVMRMTPCHQTDETTNMNNMNAFGFAGAGGCFRAIAAALGRRL
ncbi:MAG: hypothetical protein OD918_04505, partial [Gammaproteobacteria bacterium]